MHLDWCGRVTMLQLICVLFWKIRSFIAKPAPPIASASTSREENADLEADVSTHMAGVRCVEERGVFGKLTLFLY